MGTSLTPSFTQSSQKTTQGTKARQPPSLLARQCTEKASSPPRSENATGTSHDWPATSRNLWQGTGTHAQLSSTARTLPKAKEGTSQPRPAGAGATHGGSLSTELGMSLGLMQPPTDSGVSSIITPLSLWDLCLNEACFLPMPFPFILAGD